MLNETRITKLTNDCPNCINMQGNLQAVGHSQWAVGHSLWAVGHSLWAVGRSRWVVEHSWWAVGHSQHMVEVHPGWLVLKRLLGQGSMGQRNEWTLP